MSHKRRDVLGLAGLILAGMAGCTTQASDDPATGGQNESGTPTAGEGGETAPDENQSESVRSDSDREMDPAVSDDALDALATGINSFAAELYVELAAEEPDANLFASPASISLALAMAWAGAGGETADQMADTLQFPDDTEQVHPAFNALDQSLETVPEDASEDETLTLSIANELWGHEEFPFEEQFLETLGRHYGTGVRRQDFKNDPEGARQTINEWVAEETEDNIPELLPEDSLELPGEDFVVMVLTNAIYFLADWKYVFDEEETDERPFTASDGTETDVEMMTQELTVPYASVDGHQIIDLPYVGERLSMAVVLPAEGQFEAFRSELTGEEIERLLSEPSEREGQLWLPSFEYSTDFKLSAMLETMGMPAAFDPASADFTPMYVEEEADLNPDQEVALEEVFHEAYVAVDETGTEAAAATGVVGGSMTTSVDPEPFEMVVDRPFLFAIRDRDTETLLFLGQLVDAAEAQS